MGKGRTFRDDKFLEPFLNKMDRGELSRLVRSLLHDYFSNKIEYKETKKENYICQQPIIEKDRGQREDNIREFPIKKVEMKFDMFDD